MWKGEPAERGGAHCGHNNPVPKTRGKTEEGHRTKAMLSSRQALTHTYKSEVKYDGEVRVEKDLWLEEDQGSSGQKGESPLQRRKNPGGVIG
jgi:hypothetical protein